MKEFEVGEIVWFQAYKENMPIQGKIVKKGSNVEVGSEWVEDDRIFYALETLKDVRHPFIFTKTTGQWLFREKPTQIQSEI